MKSFIALNLYKLSAYHITMLPNNLHQILDYLSVDLKRCPILL